MILSGRHILIIGRILLGLFVLANSGFTIVLHSCMMGADLCCPSPATQTPLHPNHNPQSEVSLVSPVPACCEIHVAGGTDSHLVSTLQASSIESQKLVVVNHVVAIVAGNTHYFSSLIRNLSSPSLSIAPLPVEKYVLNSALLI